MVYVELDGARRCHRGCTWILGHGKLRAPAADCALGGGVFAFRGGAAYIVECLVTYACASDATLTSRCGTTPADRTGPGSGASVNPQCDVPAESCGD